MSAEAARPRVFRFVRQSRASGLACVALVHGRGLRSPAGAVLKGEVPRWLTQLPLSLDVEAFASAPPGQGGDGVLLVRLAL
jgi:DNA-nicking Smr family endonuclease